MRLIQRVGCLAATAVVSLVSAQSLRVETTGRPMTPAAVGGDREAFVGRAFATPPRPSAFFDSRTIYGADDRRELQTFTTASVRRTGGSTALIVDTGNLAQLSDGRWLLWTAPYITTDADGLLCDGEAFKGQPSGGFCTGFLIGPEQLATAGHCVTDVDVAEVAVIFDYSYPNIELVGSFAFLESDQVYFVSEVLQANYGCGEDDYAVLRLDREVLGRFSLPVRSAGQPEPGSNLALVGHPQGLPTKVAAGGRVLESDPALPFFTANLDHLAGNSGSPVIDMVSGEVEGILVAGPADFTWDGANGCYRELRCSEDGTGGGGRCLPAYVNRVDRIAVHAGGARLPCPGDGNSDGLVTDEDFVLFASEYYQYTVPPAWSGFDLNGDALVDDVDFLLFVQAYNRFECPRLPALPADVRAERAGTGTIRVSWTDRADNEDEYAVFQSADGQTFVEVARLAAGTTSATLSGLPGTNVYSYLVRAVNEWGFSPAGAMARMTARCTIPAPGGLTAANVFIDAVDIRWQDNSVGNDFFRLQGALDSAFTIVVGEFAVCTGQSSTRLIGLNPGVTYYFRVRSERAGCVSPWSNVISVTTECPTIPAPAGPVVSQIGPNSARVCWTFSGDQSQISGFRVAMSANGVDFNNVGEVGATQRCFDLTGLVPNSGYVVKLRAFRESTNGTRCYSGYTTPLAFSSACPVLAAPVAMSATPINASDIVVCWSGVSGVSAYRIAISTDGVQYNNLGEVPANATCFVASGLLPQQAYWFMVRGVSGGVSSCFTPYSNAVSATIPCPEFPAPSVVTAPNVWADTIDIAWSYSGPAVDAFRIAVSTDNVNFNNVGSAGRGDRSFRVTGLAPNTPYFIRIRTQIGSCFSAFSPTLAVTTSCVDPPGPSCTVGPRRTNADVEWTHPGGVNGFRVALSTNGVDFNNVAEVDGGTRFYRLLDLAPNRDYWVLVRAFTENPNGRCFSAPCIQSFRTRP